MGEHDAQLLLFGATGDLAANKILPALQQWETGTPFFLASGAWVADPSTRPTT